MGASYHLRDRLALLPTPAGAFYAVSSAMAEPMRTFLISLLRQKEAQTPDEAGICALIGLEDPQAALQIVYRAQQLGWVEGTPEPRRLAGRTIETDVPPLLQALSGDGKALLVDETGLYLAQHGFAHETAEEVAAMAGDILGLTARHAGLVEHNLRLGTTAWGLVDASGISRIGIWPIFIGEARFALTVAGEPRFHLPAFTDLTWILMQRYGLS
jgi:hypothetical protein